MRTHSSRPPHALLTLAEVPRACVERAVFAATNNHITTGVNGQGQPVVVLPGLMADDRSTRPLRQLLNRRGYTSYGWGLGTNIGPTRGIVDGTADLVKRVADEHSGGVSVIGWSLGGLLGLDVARQLPGLVDRLITLGSPLYLDDRRQSRASSLYDRLALHHLAEYAPGSWRAAPLPDLPATSIYSRSDGIIDWRTCLHPDRPDTENIEVVSSHCGLGFHPLAAYAILDRLGVPIDAWTKFTPPHWLVGHFRLHTPSRPGSPGRGLSWSA